MTADTRSWIATQVARIHINVTTANLLCQIWGRFGRRCASHAHCTIAATFWIDLVVHLDSTSFLKISRALLKMAIVLWGIYRAITALTLRIYVWTWHILAHSHLLSVRKLVLKLILNIRVATLASTFVCWGHIGDSYCISRLWVNALTTCILNSSLDALLTDVGSRI